MGPLEGEAAAIEYGTQGIRVNVISPGFIFTEIMAQGAEDFIPDIAARAALNRPENPSMWPRPAPFWPRTGHPS